MAGARILMQGGNAIDAAVATAATLNVTFPPNVGIAGDLFVIIYIAKEKPPQVVARLTRLREGDVGMSVITYAELSYGASRSRQMEANWKRIDRLTHRCLP